MGGRLRRCGIGATCGAHVAIRAGQHCAQPLLTWLGEESCCRASLALYNDESDIEALIVGLDTVWRIFNG